MGLLKVTFAQLDGTEEVVEVSELNQSLMQVARAEGVTGIDADCGGACACATCHVYVDAKWKDVVGPPNDLEAGMLDLASDVQSNSRLSCQIELRAELDGLRVTVAPKS